LKPSAPKLLTKALAIDPVVPPPPMNSVPPLTLVDPV